MPEFDQRRAAGELPPEDLAKLTDRALLAQGKPQRCGTQFDRFSREFKPRHAVDLTAIEENRKGFGLIPLSNYGCMMNVRLRTE